MATSLAAQLQKLAVPETVEVLGKRTEKGSFLYPEKEAATYTKQHFYNIGERMEFCITSIYVGNVISLVSACLHVDSFLF